MTETLQVNLIFPIIYIIATVFITIVPMIAKPKETGKYTKLSTGQIIAVKMPRNRSGDYHDGCACIFHIRGLEEQTNSRQEIPQ